MVEKRNFQFINWSHSVGAGASYSSYVDLLREPVAGKGFKLYAIELYATARDTTADTTAETLVGKNPEDIATWTADAINRRTGWFAQCLVPSGQAHHTEFFVFDPPIEFDENDVLRAYVYGRNAGAAAVVMMWEWSLHYQIYP